MRDGARTGRVAAGTLRIDGNDASARLAIDGTKGDLRNLLSRKMPLGRGRFHVQIRGDEATFRLPPAIVDDEVVLVASALP